MSTTYCIPNTNLFGQECVTEYSHPKFRDFHEDINIYEEVRIEIPKNEYNVYHPVKTEVRMVDMKKGQQYLQKIVLEEKKREINTVEMNPKVLSGMPVIKGTRIQVSLILACLRDEMAIEEICEDYRLEPNLVKDTLDFAIKVLDYPFYEE